MLKSGTIPPAIHASVIGSYHLSPLPPPHELLTRAGAFEQSGSDPSGLVGQTAHSPQAVKALSEQEDVEHPLPVKINGIKTCNISQRIKKSFLKIYQTLTSNPLGSRCNTDSRFLTSDYCTHCVRAF